MKKKLRALINTPVSLVKGLRVTIANLLRTKATVTYPEVMPEPMGQAPAISAEDEFALPYELAPRFRGLHGLTRDETGDHNCIGCLACALICPDDLISMTLEKREGHPGRYPVTFTINIGPCCFCGLCSEVCPTPHRALVMTDLFEWATFRRDGDNLVLKREDLEANGDYEMQRRLSGRQFDEKGRLIGVNPEDEGNPYFQLKPEYDAARQNKSLLEVQQAETAPRHSAKAPPPAAPEAPPPAAPAEDRQARVRAAFEAAGLPVPEDLEAYDLGSLDAVEDRKVRGQLKSAIVQARKAMAAPAEAATAAPSPAAATSAEDPRAVLQAAFDAAGLPVPDDLDAFDLDSLDAIEDRKVRGQLKSAVVKARKAATAPAALAAQAAEAAAAPPPAALPTEDPLAVMAAAFTAAGLPVPADLAAFDLGSLDAVEDRKVRGQLKSAVVRARRALEAGPGPAPEEPAPGAAAPAPAAEVTPAGAASAAPAAEGSVPDAEGSGASDGAAERAALIEALTAAGVTIPEVPESLTLAALDEIMDRRLRGQAKAALRKLQRALGMVD